MPTSVDIKNLKINKLTEAQYDTAVQGGVIGENELSVITDMVDKAVQVSTMPTASADELGNIYQYIGATDANYTNGYFYKCEGAGDPVVYSWVRVNVQPGSSLPSQSGNDGKFLTTDGTDASWGNTTHYLKIAGRTGLSEGGQLVLDLNSYYSSSIIFKATGSLSAALHYSNGFTITVNNYYPYVFATDNFRKNYLNYGTLGISSVPWDVTYTKALNSGPGANITVPATGGTLALTSDLPSTPATMPELTVAGWSLDSGTNKYTQSVSVTGVTGTNTVFVSPAPSSAADYASSSVLCISQTTDSLTFQADSVPSNAITVNVVIMG